MTRFEQMKNRNDNLERGLQVRELDEWEVVYWHRVKTMLENQLNKMTIEEAQELV